jgi:KDO2-lipid IV(A) lauroyltransferase
VFEEIGRNAYDFVRYPGLSPRRRRALVDVEGAQHLDHALASKRGAVIVTAHLGAWEVLAGALVAQGYPLKALAQPLREPRLEKLLRRHRAKMGIETFSSLDSPLAAMRHVRQGGFLGVLMDQRLKRGGVIVNFLGQPTRMTEAPARLAMAAKAPLVPMGIVRGSDHRHRARVLPAIETSSASALLLTQSLADALGGLIRETPEQWMWIHPRWTGPATVEPNAASHDLGEEATCGAR